VIRESIKKTGKPVVLGLNKIDRISRPKILPAIDQYRQMLDFEAIVPVSAMNGDNVPALTKELLRLLPEGAPLYPDDFLTDQPERFFVGEMVREKILHHTREELPYSTGVIIESFKEEEALVRIDAKVLVERQSQKAIVIGRGGQMLKAIGSEARRDIEDFLGTKVFLGLFVTVREKWREDPAILEEMGLGDKGRT
jgi:GTP-binding protein Era